MWPFKSKKQGNQVDLAPLACPHCKNANTRVICFHGADYPDHVRIWRAQRYVTWKCDGCGKDFYTAEPPEGLSEDFLSDERTIDDEDALHAAEEEIRRKVQEERDRGNWAGLPKH